jgi:hypothetical protein
LIGIQGPGLKKEKKVPGHEMKMEGGFAQAKHKKTNKIHLNK